MSDDPVQRDLLGRTLGDFVVKERFASGGGGDVYLAEQIPLGRPAVIKVVRAAPERFLREARLASRLDHPFAAHVYGFGAEDDGLLWMAMELVRGTPLDVLIREHGALPPVRLIPLFERLCEVVQAAHEQGIVHRDIKPQNVMVLNRAGRLLPKLLDLGLSRKIGSTPEPARGSEETSGSKLAARLADAETLDVTRDGEVVGTPHYMAPEQWKDETPVDARSDLYSLSLLAYEALSGKRAYPEAKTLFELAVAQAKQPLPTLPSHVPRALNAVLAKGAAKQASDRYATALELAAAVREASGLGEDSAGLGELPHELLETFIHEAPQPLAEAVARVDAARSTREQLAAMEAAGRVFSRWLGLVALACGKRVGDAAAPDALVTGNFSDEQWLSLAADVCRPFAPDTHLMPELVRCVLGAGSEAARAYFAQPTSEHFAAWLQQLTFVVDYPLVCNSEYWMGTRRADRRKHDSALVGPALLDAVGAELVSLFPLAQIFAPSGGMSDELFFLEGQGRHGARLVAHPTPYEVQSHLPWEFLGIGRKDGDERVERAPYKGLSTFQREDADNYFGREREAEAFANRLRSQRFLAVVGPSGAGKSSFVLAGVLPLLPPQVKACVIRPGPDPLATLRAQSDFSLLVVDQFEEVVTLCSDVAVREQFARELCDLPKVVITLRDDFLIRVQQLEALRERLSVSLQLLSTPAKEDLWRVLVEPAKRVGYGFDDPTLVDRMIAQVADKPGALALLSFTASQLWQLRDRQLQQMRAKTYEAIGGVGGALGQHAEATLAAMTDAERPLVREAFRRLVTADRTRAVLSKQELREIAGDGVVEKLVAARILVASEEGRVEIIHEALINSWPRLADWLREDAETARVRDALRSSAHQWDERGRPRGLLWRAETLAEYKVWRARYPGRLTQSEEAFAAASLKDEMRGRRIRRGLALTAFVVLAIGAAVIFAAYQEARRQFLQLRQEQARLALLDHEPAQALVYLRDAAANGADNPTLRRMAGVVSYLMQGNRGLLAQHAQAVWYSVLAPDGRYLASVSHDTSVDITDTTTWERRQVVLDTSCSVGEMSEPHLLLSCADKTVRVLDPASGRVEKTLPLRLGQPWDLKVSSRGVYATLTDYGLYRVDLAANGQLHEIWKKAGVSAMQIAAQGRWLAIFRGNLVADEGAEMGVRVFRDEILVAHLWPQEVVHVAQIDGDRLLVAGTSGRVGIYALDRSTWLWQNEHRHTHINDAALSPDGAFVLSLGSDTMTLWDASTGAIRWSLPSQADRVCWGADKGALYAGGREGFLASYDVGNGRILWRYVGQTGHIDHCLVTPDGTLVSSSEGGTARAWDARLRLDTVVDLPPARALAGPNAAGDVVAVTNSGVMLLDHALTPRVLAEDNFADPAHTVLVAMNAKGDVVVTDDARVQMWSGGRRLFDVKAVTPVVDVSIDDSGSTVALLCWDDIQLLDRQGTVLRHFNEASGDLYRIGFLGERLLVSSNSGGDLVAWDATTGKVLDAKRKAHTLPGVLKRHGDRLWLVGIDQISSEWLFADGHLQEVQRWASPELVYTGRHDSPFFEAIGRSWHLLGPGSLPLADIPLPSGGPITAATVRGETFVYAERRRPLATFRAPAPLPLPALDTLDRCAGTWELLGGHITRRANEVSCPR